MPIGFTKAAQFSRLGQVPGVVSMLFSGCFLFYFVVKQLSALADVGDAWIEEVSELLRDPGVLVQARFQLGDASILAQTLHELEPRMSWRFANTYPVHRQLVFSFVGSTFVGIALGLAPML